MSISVVSSLFIFSDINDCDPDPCQNGGICNDETNGYNCNCPSGFTGDDCETGNVKNHIYSLYISLLSFFSMFPLLLLKDRKEVSAKSPNIQFLNNPHGKFELWFTVSHFIVCIPFGVLCVNSEPPIFVNSLSIAWVDC